MVLFGLKKKSKDKSSPSSPSTSSLKSPSFLLGRRSAPASPIIHEPLSRFPSPLPAAIQEEVVVPSKPMTTLNVLVDPLPMGSGLPEAASGVMQISVEEEADISEVAYEIRRALKLPRGVSLGCYKVFIPLDAHQSAKAFNIRNPATPVHLVSHFPSYNLSDPAQLGPSLMASSSSSAHSRSSQESLRGKVGERGTRVMDWWPHAREITGDEVQVLVRLGEAEATHSQPLTLLAHFARSSNSGPSSHPISSPSLSQRPRHARGPSTSSLYSPSPDKDETPYPPVAIDVRRDATVGDILDDLVRADGRPGGVERLREKVVLWRVDMSWKEMLNCERFGGLRTGDMPWPYPPNAPEPVSMADYDRPISHTFPGHTSNLNLVSLFVYIKPEAERELARITTSGSAGETFVYPPRSSLPAPLGPSQSEDEPVSRIEAQLEMGDSPQRLERRRRRGASSRPSTAPTMGSCESFPVHGSASTSTSSAVPAFGRPRKTGFNSSTSTSTSTPTSTFGRSSSMRSPLYPTEDPSLSSSLGLGQSPLELERGVHLVRPSPTRTRSEMRSGGDWQGEKMELDLEALRRLDLEPQFLPGRVCARDVEEEVLRDDPAPELELDFSSLRSSSTSTLMGSTSNSMPPTPANELGGPYFGAGAIVGHGQMMGRGGKVWA